MELSPINRANRIKRKPMKNWRVVRTVKEYYYIQGTSRAHAIERLCKEGGIAYEIKVVSEQANVIHE